MIILGIDPGTATTGFGVIKVPEDIMSREFNYDLKLIDYGVVATSKEDIMPKRLMQLHHGIEKVLDKYKPNLIVIEMLFFGANTKTAIAVGQARGVIMLSAGTHNVPINEYSGLTVKLMLTGSGRADKKQVHEGVRNFLAKTRGGKGKELSAPSVGNIRKKKWDDNAVDAVAIAICHALKIAAK